MPALIGFPNRADAATISGGGWEAALPASNVQDRDTSKVARSTDAAKANTQFELDHAEAKLHKIIASVATNLSLNGNYRYRLWTHESSRSGAANYRDEDGVLTSQPTLEARHWHYAKANDGTTYRTTLLEGAGTNELTQSEDLTHGDWTAVNLSARNANQATGPGGTASLDELVENSSAGNHYVGALNETVTADANHAFSVFAMDNDRGILYLRMAENGAFGNRCTAWFDLSAGSAGSLTDAGTGTAVRSYIEDWTDVAAGLYRCVLVGSVGNGATAVDAIVGLAQTDGVSTSYTGDGSSSLYAGHVMLEDDAEFASSYVATTTAAASRDADLLQESDIGFTPADIEAAGGLTVLSEWVELGTAFTGAGSRWWHIGGAGAGSDPRLLMSSGGTSGLVSVTFDDGTSSVFSGTAVASLFDHVRARVVIFLDGSDWKIQLHVSVNGGAETSATAATIGSSLPAAWSANTLTIGAAPDDTVHGYAGHIRHVFAEGEKTLTEMEALEAGDNGVLYHWEAYDSQWQAAYPNLYPSGAVLLGEGVGGGSVTQDQYDDGKRLPQIEVLPNKISARYTSVEYDDTANADGYVEVGRLFDGPATEFATADMLQGAEFDLMDPSERSETDGGTYFFNERRKRRRWDFDLGIMTHVENKVQILELKRRLGRTGQGLFIADEDDQLTLLEQSFLFVQDETSPAAVEASWIYRQPLSLIEDF